MDLKKGFIQRKVPGNCSQAKMQKGSLSEAKEMI
jgi:hypothetical protein